MSMRKVKSGAGLACSVTLALVAFPVVSQAAPSVTGSIVTWPDDGWYQVQRDDTFETVCEGSVAANSSTSGGPCLIDSSGYIVINHTSGERFNSITASDESASSLSVVVEGSTISWPDNGWYQVQDSANYSSVCEGGLECTVSPGNYVVINHTTGERFSNITVSAGDTSSPSSVMVVADTISWPDDGWYQVQDATSFATLCEGGVECQVSAGRYIVINHTSGERTLVEVAGGDTDDPATPSSEFNISDSAFELIRDLAGYKSDQLAGVIPDLAQFVVTTAIGSAQVLGNGEFVTADSRFGEVATETERMLYQCSGGGTMIHEAGRMRLIDISYSHTRNVNNYEFDQCLFVVTPERVVGGSYSANGVLNTSTRSRSGSRFGEGAGIIEWNAFELVGPDALLYEVDGRSAWDTLSSSSASNDYRQSDFDYYRKTQGTEVINEMTNSDFVMTINYHPVNILNTMDLEFSGTFEDSRGEGRVLTVSTVNALFFSAGLDEEQVTHNGQISALSSDGGTMTLTAIGSGDRLDPSTNPLVDWTSVSSDGRLASDVDVSLGSYSAAIELCRFSSSELPLVCNDGSYVYSLP